STIAAKTTAAAIAPKAASAAEPANGRIGRKVNIADGGKASAGDEQRTARPKAATAATGPVPARSSGVDDAQIVDRDIAASDEEAAMHIAAIQCEIIAVDRDVAGRVERRQRVSCAERNIILEIDRDSAIHASVGDGDRRNQIRPTGDSNRGSRAHRP